jgi:hypothetical protein
VVGSDHDVFECRSREKLSQSMERAQGYRLVIGRSEELGDPENI